MKKLADVDIWYGFTKDNPRRSSTVSVWDVLGFGPESIRERKGSPEELTQAFDFARSLPDYLPENIRHDAWKQAAQVAAGCALTARMEKDERQASELDGLAKKAMGMCRKLSKKKVKTA